MANRAHLNQTIKAYLKQVSKKYKITKAVLFGSYAKGKPGKHSDIDIAIFSSSVKTELQAFRAIKDLITWSLGFKDTFDPLMFPAKEYDHYLPGSFVHEIRLTGKTIKI